MMFVHSFKRSGASLSTLLIATLATACVGDPEGEGAFDDDHIGQADFEIKQVPSGVTCIRVSVAGTTTVTKDFGQLATGASTSSLNMDRLPLGNVSISAMAFATSASATSCTANQTPLWVADAATALLEPGVVSKLDLTFRKNNPVTASVNFVGNIQALSAGSFHNALLVDGQVYVWGNAGTGDLAVPTLVSGLSNVVQISASLFYTCALKSDGTIWCWGDHVGVGVGSTTPTQLASGRTYSQVESADNHICGLSGTAAYCWGFNQYGELGVNPATTASAPHTSPITTVSSGAVVLEASAYGTCQIATDLDVRCIGHNGTGELGRTTPAAEVYTWADTPGSSPAVSISTGETGFLALAMGDGTVSTAGNNLYGQLGLGTIGGGGSNTSTQLNPIPGLTSVTAVAAGSAHVLALREDGSVVAWGINGGGELGDATNVTRSSPTPVVDLPPARLIAAGGGHSCAVTQDDGVYCWGAGTANQLGTGKKVHSAVPVRVVLP